MRIRTKIAIVQYTAIVIGSFTFVSVIPEIWAALVTSGIIGAFIGGIAGYMKQVLTEKEELKL